MKQRKLFFVFIFLLSYVSTIFAVIYSQEYYFSEGDFNFITGNQYGGSCAVRGYSGNGSIVNIPATVTTTMYGSTITYTVECVGYGGQYGTNSAKPVFGNNVTSVFIPNTVDEINYMAFDGCISLASINIPNSVTKIGSMAFNDCTSLKSITLPNLLTYIGAGAFRGCTGLTSLTIPNSVTEIGWSAFSNCTSLTAINIPNLLTILDDGIFSGCTSLKPITIPSSVTSIGASTFKDCTSFTSLAIPNSVTSIGASAFWGCKNLTSVNIPYNVKTIAFNTFRDCISLTSITIPNSVTEIYVEAFSNCKNLNSVIIPSSVTSIGSSAFADCNSLKDVTIPNSVTSIGSSAFWGCTGLKDVTVGWEIPLSMPNMYVFGNNLSNVTLHVPCGTKSSYQADYFWKTFGKISDGCSYDFIMEIPTTALNFIAGGEQKTFNLFSNGSWTVESDELWLTVSPKSGSGSLLGSNETITVVAAANPNTSQRTATIQVTLHAFDVTSKHYITVTQAAAASTLSVSTNSLNVTAAGEQKLFDITSNTNWTVSSDAVWATVAPTSGSNNGTVTVTTTANTATTQRTATITVSGTGVAAQIISVTQAAAPTPALSISLEPLNFAAAGEALTFTVTSNINWTVSCNGDWATISPTSGSNNGTVTVTAAANTATSSRTALLTVSGAGVAVQARSKTIYQAAEAPPIPALSVSTTSLDFVATGEQKSFTVTSNTDWTVSSDAAWATVAPASGNNNGTVTVTTTANTATTQRTATITVSGTGVTAQTISVTQAAATLTVIPEGTQPAGIDGKGNITLNLSVSSNATLTGSFEIQFPAGMSLDENLTTLVAELSSGFELSFTAKSNNTWLIEIKPKTLRSAATMSEYRKIMDIAYEVDKTVTSGVYEAMITDVDFTLNDGTPIQEDLLKVSINVAQDTTSVEFIPDTPFRAYFVGNVLRVESPQSEIIALYSVMGIQLYSTVKNAGMIEIPFSSQNDGTIYIIKGSVSGMIKTIKR